MSLGEPFRRAAVRLLCLLVLSGCGGAPTHVYLLAPRLPVQSTRQAGPVLLVATPDARVGLRSRDIAYSREGASRQLHYYAHHYWADTPAEMLRPLLVDALETSGAFSAIIDSTHGRLAALRLDTEIQWFDLRIDGDRLAGRVKIRVLIVNLTGNGRAILASDTLSAVVDAASNRPDRGVQALDEALSQVLGQLSRVSLDALASLQAN